MGSKGRGYREFVHDGWTILVGKGASDNDRLTFDVADRADFWLHIAGWSGSHVVVRNPDVRAALPRAVLEYAARLAAWFSKGRGARGKVEVHVCRAADVSKPRRMPPGKVVLGRFEVVKVYAREPPAGVEDGDDDAGR